jgi:YHS domain-containing protein
MKTAAMGIFSPETDPICEMEVDRDKAKADGRASTLGDETYYFCSDECKRRFDANPEKFRRHATAPPQPISTAPPRGAGPTARDRPEPDPVSERLRQAERTMNMTAADAGGRTIFATDPVCGAEVDTTDPSALRSVYQGRTFYFITPECKAEFDKQPQKYVK